MANYQDEYFRKKKLLQESGVEDLSGPTPNSYREQYEQKVMSRNAEASAPTPEAKAADSVNSAALQQGGSAATSAAAQGNTAGTAGGALMMAGAIPSPASPYLMGAGLGLQVLGAAEQNKRNQEEAQRQAYNERIRARQEAMARIASMGIQ